MKSTYRGLTDRSVNRGYLVVGGLLLVALTLGACERKAAAGTDTSSGAPEASNNTDADEGSNSGSGHLHLTGDVTLDHDFAIDGCQIAPPGDGLLSGYHMNAKDGDGTIVMLSVVIKKYDKDGPYSPTFHTAEEQVGETMATGSQDFLSVMVATPNSTQPLALAWKPASKLVVTTSGNGSKGEATFTDMGTPLSVADVDMKTGTMSPGKKLSGTVTWTCGKIDRIDPTMDKAVNGMMKKLMPSK